MAQSIPTLTRAEERWYYLPPEQREPFGPISTGELRDLAASGRLARTSRVWRKGMQHWEPVSAVPEIQPVLKKTLLVAAFESIKRKIASKPRLEAIESRDE